MQLPDEKQERAAQQYIRDQANGIEPSQRWREIATKREYGVLNIAVMNDQVYIVVQRVGGPVVPFVVHVESFKLHFRRV